jgi:hypothetical protein
MFDQSITQRTRKTYKSATSDDNILAIREETRVKILLNMSKSQSTQRLRNSPKDSV